jgi:hypothetical protein
MAHAGIRLAVLGAGHVGPVIARVALSAVHKVTVAASGDPEQIALSIRLLVPGAEPAWAVDAVKGADTVLFAIPARRFAAFDPALVFGRLVVDAMNYWPVADGNDALFEDQRLSSSEIVQRRLERSTVVRTLNHLGYHELEKERQPVGSPPRRALGVAGDDADAVGIVAELIERIGYDAVSLESLAAGLQLEPGGPVFGASLGRPEFERALRAEAA